MVQIIRLLIALALLLWATTAQAQVVVNNLTSNRDNSGCSSGDPCVTPSVTYNTGDVLLLSFYAFGSGYDPTDAHTVTASGVTWTEVGPGIQAFGAPYVLSVFYGVVASGATGTVSIAPAIALDDAGFILDRAVSGTISTSAPVTQSNQTAGTSATPATTLSAFGTSGATYAVTFAARVRHGLCGTRRAGWAVRRERQQRMAQRRRHDAR